MYCPGCGVKNEGSPLKCFICGKVLPGGDRPVTSDSPGPGRRRFSPQTFSSTSQPFAAIGDRMLALILDRVVVLALVAIPAVFLADRFTLARGIAIAAIAVAVTALAYHIVLEALFGATLGKGLVGLQIRIGPQPWLSAVVRNLARFIDALLFYAPAFVVAVFSSRRQRLGDHLAGTIVMERQVAVPARIALMFIFVMVVGGSLWLAITFCPSCTPERSLWAYLD